MVAAATTYSGVGPKVASGPAPYRYTLTLADKGQATLRTVKSSRSRLYENASWQRLGTGEISLQFLNRDGAPRGEPTIWRQKGGQLTPVSWGKTEWADASPPSLRQD